MDGTFKNARILKMGFLDLLKIIAPTPEGIVGGLVGNVLKDTGKNIEAIKSAPPKEALNKSLQHIVNGMVRTGGAITGINPARPIENIEDDILQSIPSGEALERSVLSGMGGVGALGGKGNSINKGVYNNLKKEFNQAEEVNFDALGHKMRQGYEPTPQEYETLTKEAGRRVNTMPLYRPSKDLYEEALNNPEKIKAFIKEMFGGG